jgi:hypothetical protein
MLYSLTHPGCVHTEQQIVHRSDYHYGRRRNIWRGWDCRIRNRMFSRLHDTNIRY